MNVIDLGAIHDTTDPINRDAIGPPANSINYAPDQRQLEDGSSSVEFEFTVPDRKFLNTCC